ncbi:MAG: GNAT family N-acetyltransferase [Bradyrhizobium sp.]|jgi:ribosomal protein S18 acetylase RimI-like enzyme
MDAVEIVPITQDHIDGFHRALDFVAREGRYLAFVEGPPLENTRAFVLDHIQRGHPQFVAVSAGEVVGWCDVTPKERPIYAHGGVLGIGLLPRFRGQGIGTNLIRSTLAATRTIGLHRVELTVRQNNTRAIELYRKVGFVVEGLQRDAVQIDGLYENIVCMALLF